VKLEGRGGESLTPYSVVKVRWLVGSSPTLKAYNSFKTVSSGGLKLKSHKKVTKKSQIEAKTAHFYVVVFPAPEL
jgi:hypothetical protein